MPCNDGTTLASTTLRTAKNIKLVTHIPAREAYTKGCVGTSTRERDFETKKTKLRAFCQKVLENNAAEFYFGMKSRNGLMHIWQESHRIFEDHVKQTAKEAEALRKQSLDITGSGNRTVCADDLVEHESKSKGSGKNDDNAEDVEDEDGGDDIEDNSLRKLQRSKEMSWQRCLNCERKARIYDTG
ncbi:MAG: hypothetical protein M1818_001966 [Claussenomyces sp. TS43310]|nr:MAG: hypothetical protein M1818_001966 [Claussenomyces sp. TS43310]